jgi:glycosyltransferase involved in cell wall biosynthesis
MKYIYIQPSMNFSGSEQSLYQILNSVNNLDNSIVLTFEDGQMKNKLEDLGVKVHLLWGAKLQRNVVGAGLFILSFFSIFLYGLANYRKLKNSSVIYFNTLMSPQFYILKLFTGSNTRFITHVREFHTTYPQKIYIWYFKIANLFTNSFVFCTGAIAKQDCLKNISLKSYEVIHNTSSFPLSKPREQVISHNTFRIGFVGATTFLKGIDRVLSFKEKYKNSSLNLELIIAGKITDNLFLTKKQNDPTIKFLGCIDEMTDFYKNIDCLVMVSRTETFPRVIVEAFNHGVPVIATDVGGVYEAISSGGGIVIKNEDETIPNDLYDGVKDILLNYSSYSNAAISSYSNRFSPQVINRKVLDVIR